ncbi:MAG: hypothetical protein JJE04_24725 [Acidobacteriia bacterium]|nr:hypothetical protein [Terriglobia bacterium]
MSTNKLDVYKSAFNRAYIMAVEAKAKSIEANKYADNAESDCLVARDTYEEAVERALVEDLRKG